MYSADPTYIQTSDNLVSSRTSLKLQLQSSHFGSPVHSPQGNGLILRCTARIGNLYQENAEIELGVPQRDPIPARGELSSFCVTGGINSLFVFRVDCLCFRPTNTFSYLNVRNRKDNKNNIEPYRQDKYHFFLLH